MSLILALLVGLGVGVTVSAPVGPVNVLTWQRAFQGGFPAGVWAGAGAATADTFYASIAVFGVVSVAQWIDANEITVMLFGGLTLVVYGIYIWRKPPLLTGDNEARLQRLSKSKGFAAGLAITMVNPNAMFGFFTIFAGLGALVPDPSDTRAAITLVIGVALGAMVWWSFIAGIIARFRHKLEARWLILFNHGSAVILGLFGLWLWLRAALVLMGVIPSAGLV
ncbi:MAG: LysE family transporter [Pseudomonadota bacterium]